MNRWMIALKAAGILLKVLTALIALFLMVVPTAIYVYVCRKVDGFKEWWKLTKCSYTWPKKDKCKLCKCKDCPTEDDA